MFLQSSKTSSNPKGLGRRLIGRSPSLMEVLRAAELVAAVDVNVLVTGETGTGKELLARALHEASPRAAKPFVSLNCASLSETLADSLLFGHRRGAFTDAHRDHDGFIHQAEDGTLFLDEVGELPLSVQAKLLRFLESGEYQPLGCTSLRQSRTRIVAATNRDLAEASDKGQFRRDLYYRLNVVPLHLPPLRERAGDVAVLTEALLGELAEKHGLNTPRIARDALRCLDTYRWPGNVRELRNLCERLLILLQGRDIVPESLPPEIRGGLTEPSPAPAGFRLPLSGLDLSEVERDLIRQALDLTSGNQTRAARLLGLTRDTLIYRMKKYALDG